MKFYMRDSKQATHPFPLIQKIRATRKQFLAALKCNYTIPPVTENSSISTD